MELKLKLRRLVRAKGVISSGRGAKGAGTEAKSGANGANSVSLPMLKIMTLLDEMRFTIIMLH